MYVLKSGKKIPKVGLGTWQAEPGQVGAAVLEALKAGYRLIDCAAMTCVRVGNEAEIGEAFAKAFGEGGFVKREEVFITSKLWNSEHAPEHVIPAVEKTLKDLQLDYLDVYMIHWPQGFQHVDGKNASFPRDANGNIIYDMDTKLSDTWKEMEKIQKKGLAKVIGLSNFNEGQIAEILKNAEIKPEILQVEVHPYFQQQKLRTFCAENDLRIMAYSPLGSTQGKNAKGEPVVKNSVLKRIGDNMGASAAQVAIGWSVSSDLVCIPKSVKPERIKENLKAAELKISKEDMELITTLDENKRVIWAGPLVERDGKKQPRDAIHPYYPFEYSS